MNKKQKIIRSSVMVLWLVVLALAVLSAECQQKVTIAPDQVESELTRARGILEQMKSYDIPEKTQEYYWNILRQAETAKKQGNFESAMNLAKQAGDQGAEFVRVWREQQEKYEALMKYNPPETMTYHYRNLMSQAKTAGEQGRVDIAKDLARQAGEQASMSLQVLLEQLNKTREKLDQIREELETLYPVNYPLIKRYWQAEALYQKKDFQNLPGITDQLLKDIQVAKNLSIIADKTIRVNAPQEYTKQWGDVRVYQEITPEGKLKTVIDTVPNGMRVKFIRVRLFSPDLNFYYVEVPATGKQGWIAEKYLDVGGDGY